MAIALFPGSFDPFTTGHEAVLRRVLPLFERVVVAVGVNSDKQCMFSPEERMDIIRRMMADCPTVEVVSYSGMTIDMCHQVGARCIIRGIRTAQDFEYEQLIASVNRSQDPTIETLLVMADAEHQNISSTLERERLTHQCNCPTT
ncbi:MAG: pantetheine-phosphate adenylyltransferase [Bacteroidales bacterium]|nr:pantetheine-phosphate adenylyltransferase [Bacteroidales bacterium]